MKSNEVLTALCEQAELEQKIIHEYLFKMACQIKLNSEQITALIHHSKELQGYLRMIKTGLN
ncbi:hypothetical protein [Lonepinella sp. BR2474]|uniref:hypothetical protein n=1 Tax=Lonepinella sp. BR2474 TaxID=3434548 RepID=UPI003F6E41C1